VQAVVSACPPTPQICRAGRPPAGPSPDSVCLRNLYASSWRGRRCSAAQASSDHPRWCGPHPVCQWLHSRMAADLTLDKNLFLQLFLRAISICGGAWSADLEQRVYEHGGFPWIGRCLLSRRTCLKYNNIARAGFTTLSKYIHTASIKNICYLCTCYYT